jgi:hypothetical protein
MLILAIPAGKKIWDEPKHPYIHPHLVLDGMNLLLIPMRQDVEISGKRWDMLAMHADPGSVGLSDDDGEWLPRARELLEKDGHLVMDTAELSDTAMKDADGRTVTVDAERIPSLSGRKVLAAEIERR